MHSSTAWFAFNVVVNLIFLFDAFLQFSRAYRDDSGTLVFSLVAIRKNYIRSGWFFMNLLASFPTAMFLAAVVDDADPLDSDLFRGLWVFELFKLLRLMRVKKLMATSQVIQNFWEKINVETMLMFKFLFLITLVSVSADM